MYMSLPALNFPISKRYFSMEGLCGPRILDSAYIQPARDIRVESAGSQGL
jgi:hypothetical protein